MKGRVTPLALLAVALLAMPAEAEPVCVVPTHVWDLQLTHVQALSGEPDLTAVAKALGGQAVLGGGYRDPARSSAPVRVELHGSRDGAGLTVRLESLP